MRVRQAVPDGAVARGSDTSKTIARPLRTRTSGKPDTSCHAQWRAIPNMQGEALYLSFRQARHDVASFISIGR